MEITLSLDKQCTKLPETTSPRILTKLIDYIKNDITTVSLDCFDTVIWRNTTNPSDVFFITQSKKHFNSIGLSYYLRKISEKNARTKNYYAHNTNEVTLEEIYLAAEPNLTTYEISQLRAEEVESEKEACYALQSAIELIDLAHKHNKTIIITSDTYFCEQELREILSSCLPEKTYKKISHVFCSSDFKRGKQTGLFPILLEKLNLNSDELVHIGDNYHSDCLAALKNGIKCCWLKNDFTETMSQMTRLRNYAAKIINPDIGEKIPDTDPFSAIMSLSTNALTNPENQIGYMTLGPILYAFTKYISDEYNKIKQAGKNPKIICLLRDGYLPKLCLSEYMPKDTPIYQAYISRFSAIASSFTCKNSINNYLYEFCHPKVFTEISKMLLLDKNLAERITSFALQAPNPTKSFIELINDKDIINKIIHNSTKYRKRMMTYLGSCAELKDNDTIIFVDLGYTGTAHNKLSPILKKEYNIDTYSRFLIAFYIKPNDEKKRGLIESPCFDDRAKSSLVTYISIFEKLCSIAGNSVVDYSENGEPIFNDMVQSGDNNQKINLIQTKCINFIRDAKKFFHNNESKIPLSTLQNSAAANLARLIYFMNKDEIEYLKSLKYELDMGSQAAYSVIDEKKCLNSLIRRGPLFIERSLASYTTNTPSELRHTGIELSSMLFLQERLKYDLRISDFSHKTEKITALIMYDNQAQQQTFDAKPTYDGYYSLMIPLGFNEFQVAMQFGLNYNYVQIKFAEVIPTSALYKSHELTQATDVTSRLHYEDIEIKPEGLVECLSKSSIIAYISDQEISLEPQVLHLVFRPIVNHH